MRTMLRNAAKLGAAVAASGGLLMATPVAAQASTNGAAANGTVRPAYTNDCGGLVELHRTSGLAPLCLNGNGIWKFSPPVGNIDWIDAGNQWVAFYWGAWPPASNYHPGMGPGSRWYGGSPVYMSEVDVNT